MWQWFVIDLDLKLDVDEKSDVFLPNELNLFICFLIDLVIYSSVLYTKIVSVFSCWSWFSLKPSSSRSFSAAPSFLLCLNKNPKLLRVEVWKPPCEGGQEVGGQVLWWEDWTGLRNQNPPLYKKKIRKTRFILHKRSTCDYSNAKSFARYLCCLNTALRLALQGLRSGVLTNPLFPSRRTSNQLAVRQTKQKICFWTRHGKKNQQLKFSFNRKLN